MAHGENAERNKVGVDYWSRRLSGAPPKCKYSKVLTHRVERRQSKSIVRDELERLQEWCR